jgi:hypothetical protein
MCEGSVPLLRGMGGYDHFVAEGLQLQRPKTLFTCCGEYIKEMRIQTIL